MKNKDIESMLKKSCNGFVPDVLDNVKESDKELFPEEITASNKSKTLFKNKNFAPNYRKIAFSVCLIIIMIFASTGTMIYAEAADSYIYIDINPSVEIVTKRNGDVKNIIMMNDDAEIMLSDLDYKGQNVEDVIDNLIEKAIEHGYIETGDTENEILISVSNRNSSRKEFILNKVYDKIDNQLAKKNINRIITKQSISKNVKNRADKYKISAGKLVLIEKIIELDPSYEIEDLKNKNVKELKEIYKSLLEDHYDNEDDYNSDNNKNKYDEDYNKYFNGNLDEFIQKKKRGN